MAQQKPRRGSPKPIFDLIPPARKFRRHWIKFWIERWRSSPRVRATPYEAHGLWINVVSFAAENDGVLPFTVDEFAAQIGLGRRDRRQRFHRDLAALLEAGLLEQAEDGTLIVPRFMEMQ